MIVLILDIGPIGDEEVHFTKWLIENGDTVKANHLIAEVDTDKVSVDIHSEVAGKVEFLVGPGEKIKNGHHICYIHQDITEMVKAISDKF